jgi:hypothetical protein
MEQNTNQTEQELLKDIQEILKNSEETLKANDSLNRAVKFAIDEYKTNKHWFRDEPGHVTTTDVIKTCVEYGWAMRQQYEHERNKRQQS